jgi:hypothetical protein
MSEFSDAVLEVLSEQSDGMVISFVVVVEELDDSGATTLRVERSDMAAWHALGMLEYAKDEVHEPLTEDFGD